MDPSVETRELTIDEAVAVAVLLQRNEQLDEAQAVYQRVLESVPNHPDALHYAGVLAHQQGRSDEANDAYAKALSVVARKISRNEPAPPLAGTSDEP